MTAHARRRTDLRSIRLLGRIPVLARVVLFGITIATAGAALLAVTPAATITPERAWGLPFFGLVIAFAIAAALLFRGAGRRWWLAALLSAAFAGGGVLAYTTWERGFVAQARRETVLNHRYPLLLQEQLDHWRGRGEPAPAGAP